MNGAVTEKEESLGRLFGSHGRNTDRILGLNEVLSGLVAVTLPIMFLVNAGSHQLTVAVADILLVLIFGIMVVRGDLPGRLFELARPLLPALGLFFGWLAVLSLASFFRYEALGLNAIRELFKYLADLFWLVVCLILLADSRPRHVFLHVWFVTAVCIAIATLIVRLTAWPGFVRPEVTFQHPNALANYLGASLGVAWWMTRETSENSVRASKRWLGWMGFIVIFAGVLFSTSRGGLLASFVVLGWLVMSSLQLTYGMRLRALALATVTAMLLGAFLFLTPPGQLMAGKLVGERRVGIIENRLELWHDSLELYRQSPWLGLGPGMFSELRATVLGKGRLNPHNEYVTALAEQGPVGLVAIIHFLATVIRLAMYHVSSAAPAMIGGAAVIHSAAHGFVSNVFQLRIFWVGIALVLVGIWMNRCQEKRRGVHES